MLYYSPMLISSLEKAMRPRVQAPTLISYGPNEAGKLTGIYEVLDNELETIEEPNCYHVTVRPYESIAACTCGEHKFWSKLCPHIARVLYELHLTMWFMDQDEKLQQRLDALKARYSNPAWKEHLGCRSVFSVKTLELIPQHQEQTGDLDQQCSSSNQPLSPKSKRKKAPSKTKPQP